MYCKEHNTNGEHPGCGGTFYEQAGNVQLNGKSELRFYQRDGSFSEPYYEG